MLKWILRTILYFLVAETLKGRERGRPNPAGEQLRRPPRPPEAPARVRRGQVIDPRDVIDADFRPAPAEPPRATPPRQARAAPPQKPRPARPGDSALGSGAPGVP